MTRLRKACPWIFPAALSPHGRGKDGNGESGRLRGALLRSFGPLIAGALAAAFLLAPFSPACGQGLSSIASPEVRVLYHGPSLEPAAREVIARYPAVRAALESVFLWKVDFRPMVVLVGDHRAFLRMAGHEAFVAYAVPGRQLVVIDCTRMGTHPFTLETTLKHELCHLLLHRHIGNVHLPKWLDEGVSQWVSEGIPEIVTGMRGSPLSSAVLAGTLIPLEGLSHRFPQDSRGLELAYEQSRSVVDYIVRVYGKSGILNVLQFMKSGVEADEALEAALMVSRSDLEGQWRADLRSWPVFLAYLAANVYTVLFILAGLLTLLAYIRFLVKRRRYRNWEEEETVPWEDGPE